MKKKITKEEKEEIRNLVSSYVDPTTCTGAAINISSYPTFTSYSGTSGFATSPIAGISFSDLQKIVDSYEEDMQYLKHEIISLRIQLEEIKSNARDYFIE